MDRGQGDEVVVGLGIGEDRLADLPLRQCPLDRLRRLAEVVAGGAGEGEALFRRERRQLLGVGELHCQRLLGIDREARLELDEADRRTVERPALDRQSLYDEAPPGPDRGEGRPSLRAWLAVLRPARTAET